MERFDKDHKGSLSKVDVPENVWTRISKADTNNDGSVSKDELETYFKNRGPGQRPAESSSKPNDKPAEDKKQDQKPTDSKPSAQKSDGEQPADATAAANAALVRGAAEIRL